MQCNAQRAVCGCAAWACLWRLEGARHRSVLPGHTRQPTPQPASLRSSLLSRPARVCACGHRHGHALARGPALRHDAPGLPLTSCGRGPRASRYSGPLYALACDPVYSLYSLPPTSLLFLLVVVAPESQCFAREGHVCRSALLWTPARCPHSLLSAGLIGGFCHRVGAYVTTEVLAQLCSQPSAPHGPVAHPVRRSRSSRSLAARHGPARSRHGRGVRRRRRLGVAGGAAGVLGRGKGCGAAWGTCAL